MGKNAGSRVLGHAQGKCRGCRAWFIGPGERCPSCAQELRERHRQELAAARKRRRRR